MLPPGVTVGELVMLPPGVTVGVTTLDSVPDTLPIELPLTVTVELNEAVPLLESTVGVTALDPVPDTLPIEFVDNWL